MINTELFSARLKKIMTYYDESASGLAEKIGVQRSSISHIISGRNKPSLEFVMKLLIAYPDVDLYWLINGKGSFPKHTTHTSPEESNDETIETTTPSMQPKDQNETKALLNNNSFASSSDIDRIVILFKDGSFKSYSP